MSSFYNGNGSTPASTEGYAPQAIASSTFSTPVRVNFAGPHGFNDQDTIQIEGHVGNAANGTWQISVVTATQVILNGTFGTGAGGATGYAIDYSINPIPQVPGDTDLANASSVNTPIEHTLDCVPFLYQRVGRYRIYTEEFLKQSSAATPTAITENVAWTSAASPTDDVWTLIGSAGTNMFTFGAWPTGSPIVQPNDILVAEFSGTIGLTGTSVGSDFLYCGIGLTLDGTPQTTPVAGSIVRGAVPFQLSSANALQFSGTMRALYLGVTASHLYNFSLYGLWHTGGGSAVTISGFGSYSFHLTHYRPNA